MTQSDATSESQSDDPGARHRVRRGCCPVCGRKLVGLPMPGACPKCKTRYEDDAHLAPYPKPSAFLICLLYGWPLVLLAILFLGTADDPGGIAQVLYGLVILMVSALNGLGVTAVLLQHHCPRSPNAVRGFHRRLAFVGKASIPMFYLRVIVPLLVSGGCFGACVLALG